METPSSTEKIGSLLWFRDLQESHIAKKNNNKKNKMFFSYLLAASVVSSHLSLVVFFFFTISIETNTFWQAPWVKNLTADFSRTKGSSYLPEEARWDSTTRKGREEERSSNWKTQSEPCPIWLALPMLLGNQIAL